MFISIAICEKNRDDIRILRDIFTEISIQNNIEIQLYWLFGENIEEKLIEFSEFINLSLINLDVNNADKLGRKLYKANPYCYIMYYKQQGVDLEPLLSSRPIAFQHGLQNRYLFRKKLIDICTEIWSQTNMFYYRSKNFICLLPYSSIAYFESNYKYVIIHTISGRVLQLYKKLDDIESKLTGGLFLRVHKSYLVNMKYAENIDKTDHNLYLKSGDSVCISKAYYEHVLNAFEQFARSY